MHSVEPFRVFWKKSSYSAASGDCVEVARLENGNIGVRDSKNIAQSALGLAPAGWLAFIAQIKRDRIALH